MKEEEILEDFRTELYLEVPKDDEIDVKEILIFKRVLGANPDEDIDEKLTSMTGKRAKIDFNSDNNEKFIAVSIQMIE